MLEYLHRKSAWLVCIVLVAVAIFYAPGFDGFWHGDDFPNLHRAYAQAQQGTLWPGTFRLFAEAAPSDGAFYRPMMMLSLALNYALAGAHYGAWYLVNFLVHLANTLLVALIVRRLAEPYACNAGLSAPLAALLFGLCPALAEGVYWISARADGWVTLLSLAGVYFWAGSAASAASRSAFALPLLLIAALGFKESAAVLPLQMTLLALAWRGPLSRPQRWALFAAFIAAALFLVWRVFLFGNAWQVYAPAVSGSVALHAKLWSALQSLGPWWAALGRASPVQSTVYLVCCAVATLLLAFVRPVPQWRLALALTAASGGLALATALNIGALSSSGEGGRLSYGPVAWLALAVGVFLAAPQLPSTRPARWRSAALASFAIAVVAGGGVLHGHLGAVSAAQVSMRMIAQSIPSWADKHAGLTILLVPENDGAVVLGRNAQSGIALEPVQRQPYLHRVLPVLTRDVELVPEYFCRGFGQRLETVRPRFFDASTLASLLQPAELVWPKHIACWSKPMQKIVALRAPPMDTPCAAWLTPVRAQIADCER